MEDFDLNSDPWNVSGKKDLNEGTFSSESASGSGTEPEKSDGISYSVIAVPPGGDWSGTEKIHGMVGRVFQHMETRGYQHLL